MNFCLNKIFTSLPNLLKEMDDILLESEDDKAMEGVLRPMLECCRSNEVLQSRPKIDMGPEVSYTGLEISATEDCKPSREKYNALNELKEPGNLAEDILHFTYCILCCIL